MKSNFTGLMWSATAARPCWKKSKFMTLPLTIFRLSLSPQLKRWVWPLHFKNCSVGLEIEPRIDIIKVIISKFLWISLCECQFSLSNKIKSFILISISVKHFNFGGNKIVSPRKDNIVWHSSFSKFFILF